MTEKMILRDRLAYNDKIIVSDHKPTLWARTRVIGGYGLHKNKNGVSEFDEVVFDTENMVPLIGVQYAMEMVFGVKGTQIVIPTLNSLGIGSQNTITPSKEGEPYEYGQKVCLFGVGTGGAAENNLTALDVHYWETSVANWQKPETMVPFRYTNDEITGSDANKYYGRRRDTDDNNTMCYYLKRFDQDPNIVHVFADGMEDENPTLVTQEYFDTHSETTVQSYTECALTISKKDIREWFLAYGIEAPRVNSLALYNAIYDPEADDYAQIQMFSKLNIPTEPLTLSKDLQILYRVYGA